MDHVISHTSALEVMRLKRFPQALSRGQAHNELPRTAPTAPDVKSWLESFPMARQLARPIELLCAETTASKRSALFNVHATSGDLPAESLVRLNKRCSIVSPELLLVQMASLATDLELVLLVEELCGLYALQPATEGGMLQRKEPLTNIKHITSFLDSGRRFRGAQKLRRALGMAIELSGSPQESKLAPRISWPRAKGGYHIEIVSMNRGVEVTEMRRDLAQAKIRKPDILFRLPSEGIPGLCLDYQGNPHLQNGRPQEDAARMNELLAVGLKPFAIWKEQCESTSYMDALIDRTIRRELSLPPVRPPKNRARLELARRELLLAELDGIDGLSWGVSDKGPLVVNAMERVEEALAAM